MDLAVGRLPRHKQHILDGIGVFVTQAYENDVRPWRQPADWKVSGFAHAALPAQSRTRPRTSIFSPPDPVLSG